MSVIRAAKVKPRDINLHKSNRIADNKPMQKNKKIAIVAPFTPDLFKTEYFTRVLSGIFEALRESTYNLEWALLRDAKHGLPSEFYKPGAVSGLICLSWRIHAEAIDDFYQKTHLPMVFLNDYMPKLKASMVYCESKMGILLAMKHLIKRGSKRIGMLRAPGENSLDAQERYRIYRQILKREGLHCDEGLERTCDYYFPQDGYVKTMDILKNSNVLPDALLCFNDDIAFGAIRALKELGIECPGRVAVVGYDDDEKCQYVSPTLTTVRQPLELMGGEMAHMIIDEIEGRAKGPIYREFTQELVVRRSA